MNKIISIGLSLSIMLTTIFCLESDKCIFAQETDKWEKNLQVYAEKYYSITYGNGQYVAVGQDGLISTSKDGVNWKLQDSGCTKDLTYVVWVNNHFIATGYKGAIVVSEDGAHWENHSIDTREEIREVLWNGRMYIAIGPYKKIFTSLDTSDWEEINLGEDISIKSIAYSGETMVGIYYEKIFTSIDGIHWDKIVLDELTKRYSLNKVIYDNNQFIAVGGFGDYGIILSSKDGIKWNIVKQTDGELNDVIWNKNKFVAIGQEIAEWSNDGEKWTRHKLNPDTYFEKIIWQDAYFSVNISGDLYTSTDGLNWSIAKESDRFDLKAIAYDGNIFVTVGMSGTILTSLDGYQWDKVFLNKDYRLFDITCVEDGFIAIGREYKEKPWDFIYMTSKDGIVWNEYYIETDIGLSSITWNGNILVAVGESGAIFTSEDAQRWNAKRIDTSSWLTDVVWNGEKFVAVGAPGVIATSNDGNVWEIRMESDAGLHSIIWDGKQFVAVGDYGGVIFTSPEGMTWTERTPDTVGGILEGVAWNGKSYKTVGNLGKILTSEDTITWEVADSNTSNWLEDIIWDGEKFVAVGYNGIILTYLPTDIIKVKLNNKPLIFDTPPKLIGGRTLVPLRAIFEALGGSIKWDGTTKTVTGSKEGTTIKLQVDSQIAKINDEKITLDVAAQIMESRVFVPIRFVSENLGAKVEWDVKTKTVIITSK